MLNFRNRANITNERKNNFMCFEKRIDELGRFSIPIDIRKKLNIQVDDYLNISCNEDSIIIKKVNFNNKFDTIINSILIPFQRCYQCDIVFADKEKVLYSSDKKNIGQQILFQLEEQFYNLPEILIVENLNICQNLSYAISYVLPVVKHGYPIAIIVINNDKQIEQKEIEFLNYLINI